jgi:UDP-glucose 4-epimerase
MIAVTGGTGYIGSHTVVALQQKGYEVLVLDNLSNSYPQVLDGIQNITGVRPAFEKIDLCDSNLLKKILRKYPVEGVIHFAAYKAVGESVDLPLKYYRNNLISLINLLDAMSDKGIRNFIFSSSCTVYGEPKYLPVDENHPVIQAVSPYGNTKKISEEIIRDTIIPESAELKATSLRYFNPIGAHDSAEIGEIPQGIPNNLMPYVTQVAFGLRPVLKVYGNDYPTKDGTAIRDYIHVMDLADAHVVAYRALHKMDEASLSTYNVGTGQGYSVLDVIDSFRRSTGQEIPYEFADRRAGDVSEIYANPALILEKLGWSARYTLDEMTRSSWNWEKRFRKELKWSLT